MPSYRAREELRLLQELLNVVLAEVVVYRLRLLVQREDVRCRLEFGDSYEANLQLLDDIGRGGGAATYLSGAFVGSIDARAYAC